MGGAGGFTVVKLNFGLDNSCFEEAICCPTYREVESREVSILVPNELIKSNSIVSRVPFAVSR